MAAVYKNCREEILRMGIIHDNLQIVIQYMNHFLTEFDLFQRTGQPSLNTSCLGTVSHTVLLSPT